MVHVFCMLYDSVYICVKFRENISDSFRVMKRTRMMEVLKDEQTLKISDSTS